MLPSMPSLAARLKTLTKNIASRTFSRTFSSPILSSTARQSLPAITLYGYKICPYCNKIKSLLDYLKLPYDQVEVDPLSKKELAFSPDYRKVPIVMVDGAQINDSGPIIEAILETLEQKDFLTEQSMRQLREGATDAPEVKKWTEFADKKLAVLMYPNLCASFSSAYAAFGYAHSIEGWTLGRKLLIHLAGTLAGRAGSGRLKKKYNIDDERVALLDVIQQWVEQLGGRAFHGGEAPDLADLSVFGVLRAVEGHPLHADMLASSEIGTWYSAMEGLAGSRDAPSSSSL